MPVTGLGLRLAEYQVRATGQTPPRASWPGGGRGWAQKASLVGRYGATFTLQGRACLSSPGNHPGQSSDVAGDWFPVLAVVLRQLGCSSPRAQCSPTRWPCPALVQRRVKGAEALMRGVRTEGSLMTSLEGEGQGELMASQTPEEPQGEGCVLQTPATRKAFAGKPTTELLRWLPSKELLLQTPAGLVLERREGKQLSGSRSPGVC